MADSEVRQKFEAWVTAMETAYAAENLERLTGGRGSYRVHNVACWWMAWQAAYEAGMRAGEIAMREKASQCAAESYWGKGDALDIARAIRALAISGAEESKKEK